jgi:hypothetical protein
MPNKIKSDNDERAIYVQNSSYSFVYKITHIAVIIAVIYRYLANRESSWDLLAILVLGGLIITFYQIRYKTLTRSLIRTLIMFEFATVIAIVFLLFIR